MGSNYNDCVNQCVAQYGSSPSPYVPTATMNSQSSSGPTGTGATHTVIVAPSQGVFRYVPFAVNASVGDTIKFMWGANTHTVTKSSSLTPCNATQNVPFASGTQSKGFVYTQVVNDTNPIFFHCAVATHCSKGMFGVINPQNSFGSNTSVNGMMASMMASNPSISAYSSMISNMTNSQSAMAAKWGGSINMASLPSWSHAMVAENVLYTRNVLMANPDLMKSDGTVDLSASSKNPILVPMDLGAAIQQANAVPSTSSSSSAVTATTAAPKASSTSSTTKASNGAIGASSPQIVVGLLSVVATFLLVL
jgi:plastocyanin